MLGEQVVAPSASSAILPVTSLEFLRIFLAFGFAAAIYACDWLSIAPNRLLPGTGVSATIVFGPAIHVLVALFLILSASSRWIARLVSVQFELAVWAVGSCLLLAMLPVMTGHVAAGLMSTRPALARAALGGGFWVGYGLVFLIFLDSAHRMGRGWLSLIPFSLVVAFLAVSTKFGSFDHLSLAVEWHLRQAALHRAFLQHLNLSLSVVVIALCVSLPLGWLCFRYSRIAELLDAVFGLIQVTPAIALFGLLIPFLALLLHVMPSLRDFGFAAIGSFPAIVGISAYLTLPLMRGIASGLRNTDPAVVETAKAMGLGEWRTLLDVRLPLGRPVFVAALRVAVVQGISLVTLGGLIGAGGLGAIVFEGMGQFAPDLILLGALPIVVLGLIADRMFAMLEKKS